jgi:CubicO group peptidase (beta-lactamase class C family)
MKTIILFSLGILIFILNEKNVVAQEYTSESTIYIDSLTNKLNKLYGKRYFYGFSVAIVNDKEVLYNKSFGFANVSLNKKYNSYTIQNIASVSKTLIGISLIKAQEEGKLRLNDPINKYLPFKIINPYYPDNEITIKHLATHTSTIRDTDKYDKLSYVANDNDTSDYYTAKECGVELNTPDKEVSMKDFLEKFLTTKGSWFDSVNYLKEIPGSKYEYTNIGAALAALVLEYATGISYIDYTNKYILAPLEMTYSGWSAKDVNMKNHSILYLSDGKSIPFYHIITYPDGGLISNTSDLGKYLIELIKGYSGQGKLLKKESYKEFYTAQLTAHHYYNRGEDDFDDEYNRGIFIGFTPKGYIGHTGGDPGTIVFMFFNPETRLGRILMINTWISTEASVENLFAIWNTLGKYENKLNE